MQDGSRSLYESTMNIHVLTALKYLSHNDNDFVLIGNLAISYHVKPYMCKTIDILVLDKSNIHFKYFPNNINKRNNINLNIIDIKDIGIDNEQYYDILNTSFISNNFKIASPTSIINLILLKHNINDYDKMYLEKICSNCIVKTDKILNKNYFYKFIYNLNLDFNMKNIKTFKDYFRIKLFEGTSGYPEVDAAFKDWVVNIFKIYVKI